MSRIHSKGRKSGAIWIQVKGESCMSEKLRECFKIKYFLYRIVTGDENGFITTNLNVSHICKLANQPNQRQSQHQSNALYLMGSKRRAIL